MTSVLADTIPGMRVVKAFAQEDREKERFRNRNEGVLDTWTCTDDPWVTPMASQDDVGQWSAGHRCTQQSRRGGDGTRHTLSPWPFAPPEVEVRVEGRRLTGRFTDAADLHAALAQAPHVALVLTLRPGR